MEKPASPLTHLQGCVSDREDHKGMCSVPAMVTVKLPAALAASAYADLEWANTHLPYGEDDETGQNIMALATIIYDAFKAQIRNGA